MWRILAVGLVGLAVWLANLMLPASNGEEQLRSLINIATQGSEGTMAPVAAPPMESQVEVAAQASPAPAATPLKPATLTAEPVLRVTTPSGDAKLSPVAETVDEAQSKIVLRLQQQLRRVGCFKGNLHGQWDAATRRAMARFNDRVNAHLPLDQPNPILLTLVEKYDNRACGASCSPGTAPNTLGLCVASQTVAMAVPTPLSPGVAANPAVEAVKPVLVASNAAMAQATTAAAPPAKSAAPLVSVKTVQTAPVIATVPARAVPAAPNNDWAPTIVVASTLAKPAAVAAPIQVASIGKPAPRRPAAVVAGVPAADQPIWSASSASTIAVMQTSASAALTAATAPASVATAVVAPAPLVVAALAPTPVVATPERIGTTIVALTPAPNKKKRARKSSGWGNTQVALGAIPSRPRRSASSATWVSNVFSGSSNQILRRFQGNSGGGFSSFSNGRDMQSILRSR